MIVAHVQVVAVDVGTAKILPSAGVLVQLFVLLDVAIPEDECSIREMQ